MCITLRERFPALPPPTHRHQGVEAAEAAETVMSAQSPPVYPAHGNTAAAMCKLYCLEDAGAATHFRDRDNAHGRVLSNQQPDNNAVTVESCIATCQGLGFALAGIEFSVQCCESRHSCCRHMQIVLMF
jgi:hypothetical protein